MPDIRSALIRSIRILKTSDATVLANASRSRVGPGTAIEEASPTEEGPAGYAKPAGALYNATIVIKNPQGTEEADVEAAALSAEEVTIEINYAGQTGGTDRQIILTGGGYTYQPVESGSVGSFEGFQINGVFYGADSDDVLTITPAIVTV